MPNDPDVPIELQHLLEKRDEPEPRKQVRRKEASITPQATDRRTTDRRKQVRRKKKS